MAVTGGYQHYTCDRCGKEAYLADASAEASTWSTVNRVSVDKATSAQPLTLYTMCSACRDDYIAFDRPQDDAFAAFMAQPARERAQKQANADAAKKQADQQAQAQRQHEIDEAVNVQKQADAQQVQKLNDEINQLRKDLEAAQAENAQLKAGTGKQDDKSSEPATPGKDDGTSGKSGDGSTGGTDDEGKKSVFGAGDAGTAGSEGDKKEGE